MVTSGGSITYRDATVNDAAALAAFARDTFTQTFGHLYPPEDLSAFLAKNYSEAVKRAEIEDPHAHTRLAIENGAIVGYCQSGTLHLPVEPRIQNVRELHRLYVAEHVKGKGVARALMDEALAWARGQGAGELYLSVWEENLRAQAFYRRYGFEHVGEHGFMVGSIRDRDFIWRLSL